LIVLTAIAAALGIPAHARAQDAGQSADAPGVGNELRVGGYYMNGERNSFFNKATTTAPGNMQGVEVLMRASAIGLSVRSLSGTFTGSSNVVSADADLLVGPPVFSAIAGYSKRAVEGNLGNVVYTFFRAGASMTWLIGGTGLRSNIGGAYFIPAGSSGRGTADMDKGLEGEASLIYSFGFAPLYVQFGYRTETFTPKSTTSPAPEEVRGLRLGGGLQFGGK
jgi:hypothetical protein